MDKDLAKENLETNHNFNFKDSKSLVDIQNNKKHWKVTKPLI